MEVMLAFETLMKNSKYATSLLKITSVEELLLYVFIVLSNFNKACFYWGGFIF